jgi:hypothetical protein
MLVRSLNRIPGGGGISRLFKRRARQKNDRGFLLDFLPRQSIGAEIGVHLGDFSEQILAQIVPKRLHLIDPWKHRTADVYKDAWYGGRVKDGQIEMDQRYSSVLQRFSGGIQARQVTVHRGDSADVLQDFPDEYFDWVYIDGDHLYESVRHDLELSARKVKSGGYITGDDYIDGEWWGSGVKKAVDEFSRHPAVRLIETRNCQFIFHKHARARFST